MMSERKKIFIRERRERNTYFCELEFIFVVGEKKPEKGFWPITDQDVTRAPQTDLF